MNRKRWLAASVGMAAVAVVVLTACGKAGSTRVGGDEPGGDREILRMEYVGGFVPAEYHLQALPTFVLAGDGRAFGLGPQIEIYPSPALPPIVVRVITAQAVRRVREEAERVGLKGPDKTYRHGAVADAPSTRFVYVDSAGKTHTIDVEALDAGGDTEPPGATAEDKAARKRLAEFSHKLIDLPAWLPEGSVGEEKQYEFTSLRIFVQPYTTNNAEEPKQEAKNWPLSTPLSGFGTPYGEGGTRCGVVDGADLKTLKPAVSGSNSRTPWSSGGKQYLLILRPLYPGESGCPAP